MPRLIVTPRNGETVTVNAEAGRSVMESIRNAGIEELLALCGGACACATCHVYVAPEWVDRLPPRSQAESDLLEGVTHFTDASRLSCQLKVSPALDGLKVTIAPEEQ